MRLIRCDSRGHLDLVEYYHPDIPPYAVLSHTWGADSEEVSFKDLMEGIGKEKAGYKKIEFCRKQASSDGLHCFWVDTCCIDKSSSAELSEAINSMFRWYERADKCYVYLSDVPKSGLLTWQEALCQSRWFTRGWTLQELIAPASVEFFSQEGNRLGSKESLEESIHEITGITLKALRGEPLAVFDVEERLSWATQRKIKRPEDRAYSLLGVFDIHMPLIYGEGGENAFVRLRRKINKSTNDKRDVNAETMPIVQRSDGTAPSPDLGLRRTTNEAPAPETASLFLGLRRTTKKAPAPETASSILRRRRTTNKAPAPETASSILRRRPTTNKAPAPETASSILGLRRTTNEAPAPETVTLSLGPRRHWTKAQTRPSDLESPTPALTPDRSYRRGYLTG